MDDADNKSLLYFPENTVGLHLKTFSMGFGHAKRKRVEATKFFTQLHFTWFKIKVQYNYYMDFALVLNKGKVAQRNGAIFHGKSWNPNRTLRTSLGYWSATDNSSQSVQKGGFSFGNKVYSATKTMCPIRINWDVHSRNRHSWGKYGYFYRSWGLFRIHVHI